MTLHPSLVQQITRLKTALPNACWGMTVMAWLLGFSAFSASTYAGKAFRSGSALALCGLVYPLKRLADEVGNFDQRVETVSAVQQSRWLEEVMSPKPSNQLAAFSAASFSPSPLEDYLGSLVCALIIGNSGAGKSCVGKWLLHKLTERQPAEVYILDPHGDDSWSGLGIPEDCIIQDITAIEAFCNLLLNELDARQQRKKEKKTIGNPIYVLADESTTYPDRFEDGSLPKLILRRLGTEARKFKIIWIGIAHSSNVEDSGISGSIRSSFLIINLCAIATKIGRSQWKKVSPELAYLESKAYPCVLSGSEPETISVHPTHDHYSTFKREGNPPVGLGTVRCLPAKLLDPDVETVPSTDSIEDTRQQLERLWDEE